MSYSSPPAAATRSWERAALALLVLALLYNLWGATRGWMSLNLPGVEFRQAQTAISAYYMQLERDFSLAYPTPVLGKPWSIPMEFPLYQWTVVWLSDVTKMPLTQAGRAVSLICFYLTLPAVWLLLRGFNLSRTVSLMGLAMIVISPFYMFYARAFLMETMALMFSVWFLAAYLRGVGEGERGWLLVANLAGIGAGLVKVTTFMLWLVPAAVFTAVWLWRDRSAGDWTRFRARFVRGVVAVLLPIAATLWWLHFADAVKSLNPAGRMLVSGNLTQFNFGDWAVRVSAETWHRHWVMLSHDLIFFPGLVAGLVAILAGSPLTRKVALGSLGCFALAPQIFPVLYSVHPYYYVANAVFLYAAVGVALGGLLESKGSRWVAVLAVLAVFGGQIYCHLLFYYPGQSPFSPGGSGLTVALSATTEPDEILVVVGDDWNSMIPYYAKRKAFMVRYNVGRNIPLLEEALANLANEKVGAFVLIGNESRAQGRLLSLLVSKFGLDSRPVYTWKDAVVYLSARDKGKRLKALMEDGFDGVNWVPGAEPQVERVAAEWLNLKDVKPRIRQFFMFMTPVPVSYFSSFGPGLDDRGGVPRFGAHPVTRLRFALSAGAHRLTTTFLINPDAYENLPDNTQPTDGVEVSVQSVSGPGEPESVFYQRLFAPATKRGDRGNQSIDVRFTLPTAGEIELFVGPGPDGQDSRDWASLGPLKID